MITTEILKRFELQVDDSSELSSQEELALANEVYDDIQNDRAWEWLNSSFSSSTDISVPYIVLPTDFKMVSPNLNNRSVVFVGTSYQEYLVIPFSERRKYRDQDGFCYIDIPSMTLIFTKQPTEVKPVEFDYISIAPALLYATAPAFRESYHNIIAYGMAAKFNPIELTDKAVSYQKENQIEYYKILSYMRLEDINIKMQLS